MTTPLSLASDAAPPRPVAVTSVQRNRGRYLLEWLAFHLVVGVQRFYLYLHRCDDGSEALVRRLARHYPISAYSLNIDTPPQLAAYQHAWNAHGHEVAWMAFIDGDEFLFPTQADTLAQALAPYAAQPVSALAAYWMCYGSSGHLDEPEGLVLEQFSRHAAPDFDRNRHVKSILRGGEPGVRVGNAHWFHTPRGTVDEQLREVPRGFMPERMPSWDVLRINHYVTQSYGYFKATKQRSGAADRDLSVLRSERWFSDHDRNECDDGMRWRFLLALKRQMREMQALLASEAGSGSRSGRGDAVGAGIHDQLEITR